jgi:hypothetical protein
MHPDPAPVDARSTTVARLLASMSTSLLVVFVAAVIFTAVPPHPLDPEWQLDVIGALVNNGAIALLGFLLVALAAWIDPESRRLNARAVTFRRWATAAALGFLLLAPLQGLAAWQVQRNAQLNVSREIMQSTRNLSHLREVVTTSLSAQELSARLQAAPGGNDLLRPTDLSQPLPLLRKELMASVEQGEKQLQQRRLEAPAAIIPWTPLKQSLRLAISALAYAYAFAFASGLLRWGPNRFATIGKSVAVVDENYYQRLSGDEPGHSP